MNKYLKIFSPLVFILSLAVLIFFKSIPTGKLWKEYNVLYVPVSADDNIVLQAISDAGIKNEVVLSKQYLPVTLPENSVEISMFKLNTENPDYNYYIRRNMYFFDKSQNYRLYYIPSEYKKNLYRCIDILDSKNIKSGMDSSSSYPWIIPVITFLLIIILSLFVKNKIPFLCGSLVSVVYLFSNPFYPLVLANLLIILCLFFISNLWKRKGCFNHILKNYTILVMIIASLVCSFAISIKCGLLFFVELICIASVLESFSAIEDYFRSKKSFNPVYIKSAKMIPMFAHKANFIMTTLIICSVLCIGIFFLSSSQTISSKFTKVLLPAVSNTQSEELPQLEDYYKWIWNIKTYPYRTLNKDTEDYFIEYPRYENENGIIRESKTVLAYNQNFKENEYSDISRLSFDSIEKVLQSEGTDFKTNYTSTNSYSTSLFSVIMMLFCLFVLLFIYFSIIIKKDLIK